MAKRKSIGKLDFKRIATNAVTVAGTGAVAQVLKEAVLVNDPETMDYIMIGGGLVLPELIKNETVATAGNALLAIGAYRMADRLDLAGELGINDTATTPATPATPATSGWLPQQLAVGNSGWNPVFHKPGKKQEMTATTTAKPGKNVL